MSVRKMFISAAQA